VTQKIIRAACRIAHGSSEQLLLGNLDIHRDWGWAPEYVEVMWSMLQQQRPQDFIVATGRSVSLEYFVERAFARGGLDWRQHVRIDPALFRPSDIRRGAGSPALAQRVLGWKARHDVDAVIQGMWDAAQSAFVQSTARKL
jgi:GDPmannose 4,6-dehydratase